MYIYLLFANNDIIGAYRSKHMAEMDRDLLEEVPVNYMPVTAIRYWALN